MNDKEKYSLKNILDNANIQLDTLMKEIKVSTEKDIDLLKNKLNKYIKNKEELTLEKEEVSDLNLDKEQISNVILDKKELTLDKEEDNSFKKLEENLNKKTDIITNSGNEVLEKALDSAKKIEEKVNKILNIF